MFNRPPSRTDNADTGRKHTIIPVYWKVHAIRVKRNTRIYNKIETTAVGAEGVGGAFVLRQGDGVPLPLSLQLHQRQAEHIRIIRSAGQGKIGGAEELQHAVGQGIEDQVAGGSRAGSIGKGRNILHGIRQGFSVEPERQLGGNALHFGDMGGENGHVAAGAANEHAIFTAQEAILAAAVRLQGHRAAGGHHQRGGGMKMRAGMAQMGGAFAHPGASIAPEAIMVVRIDAFAPFAGIPVVTGAAGAGVEGKILVMGRIGRMGMAAAAAAMGERAGNSAENAEMIAAGTAVIGTCHGNFSFRPNKAGGFTGIVCEGREGVPDLSLFYENSQLRP